MKGGRPQGWLQRGRKNRIMLITTGKVDYSLEFGDLKMMLRDPFFSFHFHRSDWPNLGFRRAKPLSAWIPQEPIGETQEMISRCQALEAATGI